MKNNAEKLKEELKAYQITSTEQVEAYCADIREQREKLEDLWKSVNDAMRRSHDSDVITGFKDTLENLEGSLNQPYRHQPELSRMVISKSSFLSGKYKGTASTCVFLIYYTANIAVKADSLLTIFGESVPKQRCYCVDV